MLEEFFRGHLRVRVALAIGSSAWCLEALAVGKKGGLRLLEV
jgi:hypothetical protein